MWSAGHIKNSHTVHHINNISVNILKRNLADVGMAQCMNALADKVHKQDVPCTQWYALHTMTTFCNNHPYISSSIPLMLTGVPLLREIYYTDVPYRIRSPRARATLSSVVQLYRVALSLYFLHLFRNFIHLVSVLFTPVPFLRSFIIMLVLVIAIYITYKLTYSFNYPIILISTCTLIILPQNTTAAAVCSCAWKVINCNKINAN